MKYLLLLLLSLLIIGCDGMTPKEQYDKLQECKKYDLDYTAIRNTLNYSITSIECSPKEN